MNGPIIIKRVKKRHGHEAHGGSWKVAYADFVTALMAFFLLMWLLSALDNKQKAAISEYFNTFSIFDSGSLAPLPTASPVTASIEAPDVPAPMLSNPVTAPFPETDAEGEMDRLTTRLQDVLQTRLAGIKDQVSVERFQDGVRIQLVDQKNGALFALGSASVTEPMREALRVVTENIRSLDHRVAIEGHTDSLSFAGNHYDNWDLSVARASNALRVMEEYGLPPERVTRVSGHACAEPLIPSNPADPRNRRISILILGQPRDVPDASR